jgi:hypothetical protein
MMDGGHAPPAYAFRVEVACFVVLADTRVMLARSRLHRLVVAGLAGIGWLVVPGVAGAQVQPHSPSEPPADKAYVDSSFELQASNGYTVTVNRTSGSKDVYLTAAQGDARRGRLVIYGAAGAVAATTRLHATLGAVAEIDVSFEPSGRTTRTKIRKPCSARKRLTIRHGTWSGTIHFAGELAYSAADAVSAPGQVVRVPRMRCNDPKEETGKSSPLTLGAFSPGETGAFLLATRVRSKLDYAAFNIERAGALDVVRGIWGRTRGSALTPGAKLSSATLAIPREPFAGTGSYTRTGPDGAPTGTFTGDLTVAFPGLADRVALGGADWSAILSRGEERARARVRAHLCVQARVSANTAVRSVCP